MRQDWCIQCSDTAEAECEDCGMPLCDQCARFCGEPGVDALCERCIDRDAAHAPVTGMDARHRAMLFGNTEVCSDCGGPLTEHPDDDPYCESCARLEALHPGAK